MVDFLFTLGQALSVALLLYGAILVLMPLDPKPKRESDEMQGLHLRTHA